MTDFGSAPLGWYPAKTSSSPAKTSPGISQPLGIMPIDPGSGGNQPLGIMPIDSGNDGTVQPLGIMPIDPGSGGNQPLGVMPIENDYTTSVPSFSGRSKPGEHSLSDKLKAFFKFNC